MDPSTPHGGPSGELRCRYIFRCYSAEQESCLSFEGFKWVVLLVLLDRLKMVLRDYHGLSMVKSSYVTKNLMVTQWLTQISFFILLSIKAWWSSLLSIECSHGHLSYPAQNFPLDFSLTHHTKRPPRCTVWLCRTRKWRLWLYELDGVALDLVTPLKIVIKAKTRILIPYAQTSYAYSPYWSLCIS